MRTRQRLLLALMAAGLLAGSAQAATPSRLDSTFGRGGLVRVPLGAWGGFNDIVARPDGRLLVAGRALPAAGDSSQVVLQQYTSRGALDRSFGHAGTVTLSLAVYTDPNRLLLLPDGRALVVGTAMRYRNRSDVFLVRFLPDGRLDPTFGSAGTVVEDAGTQIQVRDAALQADGKVVLAGMSIESSGQWFAERYTVEGTLDETFGIGGTFTLDGLQRLGAGAYAVLVQPDGRIVLAGGEGTDVHGDCATLLRLLPVGVPDPLFGTGGRGTSCSSTAQTALLPEPDGGFLGLGPRGRGQPTLTRWTSSGAVDTGFGAQGTQPVPVTGSLLRVLRDSAGRLLMLGFRQTGQVVDGLVVRTDPQGRPDQRFGPAGSQLLHLNGYTFALRGVLAPSGRLTLAGGDGPGIGHTAGLLVRLDVR